MLSVNHVYQNELKNFEMIYNYINEALFNGILPDVLITIQPEKKDSKLGWYCSRSYWTHRDQRLKQINIVPENMSRTYIDLCETLLHECVHLFCDIQGYKTTSYHNLSFKKAAEDHGLTVDKGKKMVGIVQSSSPKPRRFLRLF